MTPQEYGNICTFVQKHSGIVLSENKAYLVESRLTPIVQQFGFENLSALAQGLKLAKSELCDAVIDAMTTNESFFFRDGTPFNAFKNTILPALVAARRNVGRLRIWCAAASTGQEPYSLAIQLMANKQKWAGMSVEILGTDLSPTALKRAEAGRYTQFEVQRGLPVQLLVEHFTQDGNDWVISESIRKMVNFRSLNLLEPMASLGQFDLVFCRNVLIYFDVETKAKVLAAIHQVTRPDGYLVLGAAETLMGISDKFERADDARGVYLPTGPERARLSA